MPVKIRQMMAAGLSPVGAFLLPNDCWTTNYYIPQREAQRVFLERHADNPFAVELVRNQRHEAAMFDAYNRYYGYVFYICRKL